MSTHQQHDPELLTEEEITVALLELVDEGALAMGVSEEGEIIYWEKPQNASLHSPSMDPLALS